MTPDDLKAERAALERAIEQRQRQIDEAATLAWCEARNDVSHNRTPDAQPVVTKSARQPMTNDMSAAWQQYIAREIDRVSKSWVQAQMSAVGQVLAEERKRVAEERAKMRAEFAAELAKLKIELLQTQLDEARGLPKRSSLKVVPPPPEQLIG